MLLIGLTGPAGSGKDSAANVLEAYFKLHPMAQFGDEYRKVKFKKVALADPLKRACEQVWPTARWWGGYRDKAKSMVPHTRVPLRRALEHMGDAVRGIDLDAFIQEALYQLQGADVGVVTDVRRENEADLLRREGGYLVSVLYRTKGGNGGDPSHPTQQEWTRLTSNYRLDNRGTDKETMIHWESFLEDVGWLAQHKEASDGR